MRAEWRAWVRKRVGGTELTIVSIWVVESGKKVADENQKEGAPMAEIVEIGSRGDGSWHVWP